LIISKKEEVKMLTVPVHPSFKVGDLVIWREPEMNMAKTHGLGPFVVQAVVEGLSPEVSLGVKIRGGIGEIVLGSSFFVLFQPEGEYDGKLEKSIR
jgi:hypothetical protein